MITAALPQSSQALAVDFFETIRGLSTRDEILNACLRDCGLDAQGTWSIELEKKIPRSVLGEPRSSQIDAVAETADTVVLFECKFTEPDGGSCSQPLAQGASGTIRQCNGNYETQVNPVNNRRGRCALTAKGVRYWEFVPSVMNFSAETDYRPCPFAGGWYQWMRNLVAAAALGQEKRHAAVVLLYVDGPFPMAQKLHSGEWQRLERATAGRRVPLRAATYQRFLRIAVDAAGADRETAIALEEWMHRKFSAAGTASGV